MEVWWTAVPELPAFAIGLWRTKEEAQNYILREKLGHQHDCFQPVPIVVDNHSTPEQDEVGDA